MKQSIVPSKCKVAKLKPLFKKGSRTDPKNYRPISLLPLISKIFEKVVHDQVQAFLETNEILYKYQSGFRGLHSTDTCLTHLNNTILTGFDKGMVTGMILIDLQKAFDTIDHKILLGKLKTLNFSSSSIKWFDSYLSDRYFKVSIDNEFSKPATLSCGVPQGSILGPLLFLLYINDMPRCLSKATLYLYADDSCLVFQSKSVDSINEVLNNEFAALYDWFVDNKLSIHFGEDKTKCILFCPIRKKSKMDPLNISFGNTKISQHNKVNYLGCILDDCLSGETMFFNVLKKINSRLSFLYRKQKYLTPYLRRLLCNALIQPHFDYACSAWYPNLNLKLKKKLQASQNRCIKFCLKMNNRTRVNIESFEEMNWLPVKNRFELITQSHIYKFFNSKAPKYYNDFLEISEAAPSTRRNFMKLTQPGPKTEYGKKSFSFFGPFLWNKLDRSLKETTSLNSFKHALKKSIFENLKLEDKNIYKF